MANCHVWVRLEKAQLATLCRLGAGPDFGQLPCLGKVASLPLLLPPYLLLFHAGVQTFFGLRHVWNVWYAFAEGSLWGDFIMA